MDPDPKGAWSMGLVVLGWILAQEKLPTGNGWQGWLFVGLMIGVPIVLARVLSRGK